VTTLKAKHYVLGWVMAFSKASASTLGWPRVDHKYCWGKYTDTVIFSIIRKCDTQQSGTWCLCLVSQLSPLWWVSYH